MTYGSTDGVTELAPALGTINAESTPTSAAVEGWLLEGNALIHASLSAAGYVVPAVRTAAVWPLLRALEVLYATAYALRARGLDYVQGQQESRSEVYLKDFFARLKLLASQDLTELGLVLKPTGSQSRIGVRSRQLRRVDGYSAEYGGTLEELDGVSE